jgi:hypothetical protein|tara:strand:- start:5260 stop:6030 length:771 start_codon:yes stop_codon:yes gene_type:complete
MAGKSKIVRGALEAFTDIFKKGDDVPVDKSRRSFVKGAAVAPVIAGGALVGIKAGKKLIDDIPVPVKKEVAQETAKEISESFNASSFDWINELYSGSPKLRQMIGKDIQREYQDIHGVDEMLDMEYGAHWFGKTPKDYEKVFVEFREDTYGPALNFEYMGKDFRADLVKFLTGETPKKGGIFSEFSNAYKQNYKTRFPEDDVNSKRFEAGQREMFMKQLFAEDLVEAKSLPFKENMDKIFKKIEEDSELYRSGSGK